MNEHSIREILEGGGGAAGFAFRAVLYLPGKLYGIAMRLRRGLYRNGTFASTTVGIPVVSVGNITAGGSGKTPLVALLANHCIAKGKVPAILLRGYRSENGGGSDEEKLYQKLCPRALVQVGSNRSASARMVEAAGANVILMDDGFQHRKLNRNLDIVLIDATSPWGGGNTIPGGLLREPLSALACARVIVITRSDQIPSASLAAIVNTIEKIAPDAALFTARHKPVRLRTADGASIPLETLRGKQVVLLSGIARPEAFAKTLASLGAKIADSFIGNDHRHFSKDFIDRALLRSQQLGAVLVTTEKDEAKNLIPLMADNNSVDNNRRGKQTQLWILGVEQDVDNVETLFRIVDGVGSN